MAQGGALVGRITSAATGEPLAHSIIAIAALDREQFTSDSGTFQLNGVRAGRYEMLVRRLGYKPTTVILEVREGARDSITVALDRVALVLDRVTVRSWPPCRAPGAPTAGSDSVLARVFEQVKLNVDQFRLLSREYPYRYKVSRTMTNRTRDGKLLLLGHDVQEISSDREWDYRPGQIMRRRGRITTFRIPTLAVLADDRFLASHCFHYSGLDLLDSVPMVRIDLVASEAIESPDVNGSMYLDPTTYQIRRTVLYLSKRTRQLAYLAEMRVTTDFGEYLPSIPIIVQVNSVQVMDPEADGDLAEAYDEMELMEFTFRGRRPGG